jgi:hypothetical protein
LSTKTKELCQQQQQAANPLSRSALAHSLYPMQDRLEGTQDVKGEYQELVVSSLHFQQQQQQQDDDDVEEKMMHSLTNALAICISNAPMMVPVQIQTTTKQTKKTD